MAGCAETVAFCREHDLPHQVTGKLVVATEPEELPRMAELARRGVANGVEAHELDQAGMRAHEPHVRGIAALYVPSTGICDYRLIAEKLGELVAKEGGEIQLGRSVPQAGPPPGGRRGAHRRPTTCSAPRWWSAPGCAATSWRGRPAPTRACGSCRSAASTPGCVPPADDLVKGLIYPVPDPAFPFLGVHATRGIDGTCTPARTRCSRWPARATRGAPCGPRELARSLAYPGMLRLARQHWRYGLGEVHRSLSRSAMAAQIQRMLPDVRAEHLVPAGRRGARPGGAARTARWSTTSCSSSRVNRGPGFGAARAERALTGGDRGAADRSRDPAAAHRRAAPPLGRL